MPLSITEVSQLYSTDRGEWCKGLSWRQWQKVIDDRGNRGKDCGRFLNLCLRSNAETPTHTKFARYPAFRLKGATDVSRTCMRGFMIGSWRVRSCRDFDYAVHESKCVITKIRGVHGQNWQRRRRMTHDCSIHQWICLAQRSWRVRLFHRVFTMRDRGSTFFLP